jgi:hypothetical protein
LADGEEGTICLGGCSRGLVTKIEGPRSGSGKLCELRLDLNEAVIEGMKISGEGEEDINGS